MDVINILKTGEYENLNWSIGAALSARPLDFPGIYTCSLDDGLDTIFDTLRRSRIHRLMVVDESNYLKGVLSLSDILNYILVEGPEDVNVNSSATAGNESTPPKPLPFQDLGQE